MNVTDAELYEQAKRVLRGSLGTATLGGDPTFVLACHECGFAFPVEAELGMVAEHAELAHSIDVDGGEMVLDLVWIGEGPPPEPHS